MANRENKPYPKYKRIALLTRMPDGVFLYVGVTIDAAEKTYSRSTDQSHWFLDGRILVETHESDPDYSSVYIIDSITENQLRSRWVDKEIAVKDWGVIAETTTPFEWPPVPEGYEFVKE